MKAWTGAPSVAAGQAEVPVCGRALVVPPGPNLQQRDPTKSVNYVYEVFGL